MSRMRIITRAAVILTMAMNASAEEISPAELMRRVVAKYQTLPTYKAEGTISTKIERNDLEP